MRHLITLLLAAVFVLSAGGIVVLAGQLVGTSGGPTAVALATPTQTAGDPPPAPLTMSGAQGKLRVAPRGAARHTALYVAGKPPAQPPVGETPTTPTQVVTAHLVVRHTAVPLPIKAHPSSAPLAAPEKALWFRGQKGVEPVHHAIVSRAPVARKAHGLVYAAIGASESVGVGADDPATQSWVAVLARRLPAGSHLHNFGISGILLGGALQRELPGAVGVKPALVTVWNAVNDINAQVPLPLYKQQLSQLLDTLRRHTHARVFVGNVPALGLVPVYARLPKAQRDAVVAAVPQWNAVIARVAAKYGAVVVDLYKPSLRLPQHPDYVSGDGFHPSTAGYRDVAATFWTVIRQHDPAVR